jgi:hypothetical protein
MRILICCRRFAAFFGVVTEYTLTVFSAPASITSSLYYYPLDRIEEVGEWAGSIARELPRKIEFSINVQLRALPCPRALIR